VLFVPYNTDAPIYHLPIATGAIILVNVVVFFCTTWQVTLGNFEEEEIVWLILEFNQINPLQWITGSFMHGGLMHLFSNMFFLWAFGLVIEGKVGSLIFTAIYFLITLIDGAAVQVPMFFISGESGALGASGVIFGLMMIAMIWAPENEIDCFFWIVYAVGTAEIRLISLCVSFMFLQLAFLVISGFAMSSEMLHVIGAMIGTPIGFLMLRQGMVDCEGWDVISRNSFLQDIAILCPPERREEIKRKEDIIYDPVAVALAESPTRPKPKTHPKAPSPMAPSTGRPSVESDESLPATATKRNTQANSVSSQAAAAAHPEFNRLSFVFRQAVEAQSMITAEQAFHRIDHLKLADGLSDKVLFRYAAMLGASKRSVGMLRPLQLVAQRDGLLANEARLRIALIQLRVLKKPELATATLRQIQETPDRKLKPEMIQKRNQLLAEAQR
jgi:membrane associated rhomboid family serine protease